MSSSAQKDKRKGRTDLPEETGGEKIFDLVNYYGIGWGLNTTISVISADIAFNRPGNWLYNFTHSAIDKGAQLADKISSNPELEGLTQTFKNTIGQVVTDNRDLFTKETFDKVTKALDENHYNQAIYTIKNTFLEDSIRNNAMGESAQTAWHAMADKFGETFTHENIEAVSKQVVRQEISREVLVSLAGIMALCAGGFILMAPVKYLEDNKPAITRWLDKHVVDPVNHLIGKAPSNEQEQAQQEEKRQKRYDYLEHDAPRQSWASILTGRIASLIPIYALHVSWWKANNVIKSGGAALTGTEANPDPEVGFGGMKGYMEKPGEKVFEALHKHVPFVENAAESLRPKHTQITDGVAPFTSETWAKTIGGLTSSDMIYSLIAAIGTEHISKSVSAILDKHEEQEGKPCEPCDEKTFSASPRDQRSHLERSYTKEADSAEIPKEEQITSTTTDNPARRIAAAIHEGAVSAELSQEQQTAYA